jgi:hypothetical protein
VIRWARIRRAAWSYLRFFLYLLYYFEVGLFLIVAPWSEGWGEGVERAVAGQAAAWLRSGYVRGGLSGLGVVHLGWGILEALAAARSARERARVE